jgi:hypothetical protein
MTEHAGLVHQLAELDLLHLYLLVVVMGAATIVLELRAEAVAVERVAQMLQVAAVTPRQLHPRRVITVETPLVAGLAVAVVELVA